MAWVSDQPFRLTALLLVVTGAASPPASGISQVSLKDSVRVATVDNFQGEESTIVILSLVRNNKYAQLCCWRCHSLTRSSHAARGSRLTAPTEETTSTPD